MRAHLDGETTRLCTAWRIERRDGQSFFFTDHDRDLVYGGNTYLAATGFDRTAISNDLTFAVDNLDLVGITDPEEINETEIRAGLFDGADVYIFLLVFDDPDAYGELKLRKGRLGETRLTPQGYFTAEIRGLAQPLAQSTLKVITPECTVDLGGAACTFPIWPAEVARETAYAAGQFVRASNSGGALSEDFDDRIYECMVAGTTAAVQPTYDETVGNDTVDGTATFRAYEAFTRTTAVAAITDNRVFTADAALDAYADGWFDEGLLVFDTGSNAGMAYDVKKWTNASRTIELWEAARLPLVVGDKLRIAPGCHKRILEDCRDKPTDRKLRSAAVHLAPIRYPLRLCSTNQALSRSRARAEFAIPLGWPRFNRETDNGATSVGWPNLAVQDQAPEHAPLMPAPRVTPSRP